MPPPDPTTDPTTASDGGILGLLGRIGNPAAVYQGNLNDPTTQAAIAGRGLLAMAGGFADAAMPSRMPIPFGAALGHAAAAMGPAQDAVMAARLQAAQQQQEQALASLTRQQASAAGVLSGELGKWYGQGAGPTVTGTIGAENPTTAPHDAGPGWMAGYTIPPNTPTATPDPKKSGSENLNNLAQAAAPIALPGYTVKQISGYRPGAEVAGGGGESQHAKDNAADFQIYGPDGKPIANEGPDATGAYGKLALTMRMIASKDIKPWLGWGGNFSTGVTGPADLMHFDFAGDRGRFGSLAQMEQQWYAANAQAPGGPTVAAGPSTGTTISTPGSWFGNSPGWTDKSDKGKQANGLPVSAGPGIALPTPRDSPQFGGWYDVTMPNGKTLRLQQTDVGPGAKGRGIDINSVAAAQFGYTPSSFPTDQPIRYQPAPGPGAAPPIQVAANAGPVTDAPTSLLAPRPQPVTAAAAPAPGAPAVAPSAAPPAGPSPGALPPAAAPQVPGGQPPSLVPAPPAAPTVPPPARPQVAAAPLQPTAPGVPAIPGAPSPERIAQAQRIAAAWAMAFPGRALPPDIEATAKFGLVGPTAQAQAAGTAAGQQPYQMALEQFKAQQNAQWQLFVKQNEPVLTRPNTLQWDPQTGRLVGNYEAVGSDGNLHRFMMLPTGQKQDFGPSQISPYAASGQKAVADKNAEDYATVTKNAAAAAQAQAQATNMRQEAPNFYTGFGSSYNQELNKILLAIHPDDPARANKVASYETFMKDAGLYARQQAQAASARAGVQELKFVASSTPSEETSPRGLDRVLAQIQGISDYNLAKQQAMNSYVHEPGRNGWDNDGFEAGFNATVSPYAFMYMRYSAQDRAEIAQKLAQTKEGQAEIPRLQAQIKYITDNNLAPRL